MRHLTLLAVLLAALFSMAFASGSEASGAEPPRGALKYRSDMIRSVRFTWGMNGPVAVMSAQVHQESAWNEKAESKFAQGIAQFTPQTAEWIAGAYHKELGGADPFNPQWALRALIQYDYHLHERLPAASPCDAWAFTLAAYNGGSGWIAKERALTVRAGDNPKRWFGGVEKQSARATWAWKENRAYPRRILILHQPIYRPWGPGVDCSDVSPA